MDGRKEQDIRIINQIKEMLKDQPDILKAYSYSFGSKEMTTKKAYIGYIITFLKYLKDEIKLDINDEKIFKTIRPNHINQFMEYIKYTNGKENGVSIRATKLFAVSNFFEFLIDNGYIDENPCQRIKPPKDYSEKEVVSMTVEEIKILEKNIKEGVGSHRSKIRNKKWINRDLAIVMLGCSTGLRVSAITQINIDDIDFIQHKIKVVEKGGVTKRIYIGDKVEKQLLVWINDREKIIEDVDCNALFISNQKKRMTTECVRLIIKRNTYNIDKPITPHKMRSTCATRLYEQTGDIYLVQKQLGHKNINNTKRYAKVNDARLKAAADILNETF